MFDLFFVGMAVLLFYFAWRAIKGGFERPQSEKLNGYGIVGLGLLIMIALSLIRQLMP